MAAAIPVNLPLVVTGFDALISPPEPRAMRPVTTAMRWRVMVAEMIVQKLAAAMGFGALIYNRATWAMKPAMTGTWWPRTPVRIAA
jgi:hypothetical protein